MIIRYTAAVGKSAAVFGIQKPDGAQWGTEERKNMKNKEFKKGIAIGVASTLVVTGTVFASYQKMLFPKGNALSDVKFCFYVFRKYVMMKYKYVNRNNPVYEFRRSLWETGKS